jgi:hypothetical protein
MYNIYHAKKIPINLEPCASSCVYLSRFVKCFREEDQPFTEPQLVCFFALIARREVVGGDGL